MRPASTSLRISLGEPSGIFTLESGVEIGVVISPTVAFSGVFLVRLKINKMPSINERRAKKIARTGLMLDFFFGVGGVGVCW